MKTRLGIETQSRTKAAKAKRSVKITREAQKKKRPAKTAASLSFPLKNLAAGGGGDEAAPRLKPLGCF